MKERSLFKNILCMLLIILLSSGCSVVNVNKLSIEEAVNSVLTMDSNLKSVSFEGYSYYLPQGVILKSNNGMNSTLYYNHKKMYLYVDLVSYYHKTQNPYQVNKNTYYSRRIDNNNNNKSGYIEITEIDNKLFVEFMYNYSKVEAYTTKTDLNKTLTTMAYILNSVKFKDNLLDSLIGEASINYHEETYNIYKTSGNVDNGNYLEYFEEYDNKRKEIKDEDTLEIEKIVE